MTGSTLTEMTKTWIKNEGFHYVIDEDGDYRLSFGADDDDDIETTVLISQMGDDHEVFVVKMVGDYPIEPNDMAKAMMVCNTWNDARLWPKAYLHTEQGHERGLIVLEHAIFVKEDVSQAFFDSQCGIVLAYAFKFFRELKGQMGAL